MMESNKKKADPEDTEKKPAAKKPKYNGIFGTKVCINHMCVVDIVISRYFRPVVGRFNYHLALAREAMMRTMP